MLFTSFEFFVFVSVVFCLYYLPGMGRWQVPFLVLASLCFYAWHAPMLLLLLGASISINAAASAGAGHSATLRGARLWAVAGVVANLLILSFFKYGALLTRLFVEPLALRPGPGSILWVLLHLPLPIGISFYTFEGISLVVDLFRRRRAADQSGEGDAGRGEIIHLPPGEHILRTSLFVTFFPHLIAGPILKAHQFFPQIGSKRFRDIAWAPAVEALITGYFLKMVVADNLKDYTFWISYPYYQSLHPLTSLTLLFAYSMQIFADFAGYSLIAIGLGRLFGYELPQNFNFPYVSRSLAEFWRRWHISLSTWLRDYLYIPLGGNRRGNVRTYVNLMIVMGLGGLWHGAAWSYAVWGIYHGLGLAVERLVTQKLLPARWQGGFPPGLAGWFASGLLTLSVFSFVTLGWLLFKLPSGWQGWDFLFSIVGRPHTAIVYPQIIGPALFSIPVVIYHLAHYPGPHPRPVSAPGWGMLARPCLLGVALVFIVLNSGSSTAFIYFQF